MPDLKCMEQRYECGLSISMGSLGALVSVKERIPMHVMSLFEQGLQHRTVNTICSAISVMHDRIDGVPLGTLHRSCDHRVLIYNERPPKANMHLHGMWEK